ncbi:MAG: glycosyltransferase [Proteobacteria bacterium]|nr:glycosyltransferase [Pseudomonadota bacterium]
MPTIATLLVGARPEPFLAAALASLNDAVDRIVVNDNSGDPLCANRAVLEASALFRSQRMEIVDAPFEGFARARNHCLDAVRRQGHHDAWIFMVDADEVHGGGLETVTRGVLASLPPSVGVVDAYVVQFLQTLDYYISLDRRHNLFFRLTPETRYERDVHEQLQGVRGRRLCLPYVYHHYGYVRPNQEILDKWRLYQRLGDKTYKDGQLAAQASSTMFVDHAPQCIPYTWSHPPVMRDSRAQAIAQDSDTDAFVKAVSAYLSHPRARWWARLRSVNYRLRLGFRLFECLPWMRHLGPWFDLARQTLVP